MKVVTFATQKGGSGKSTTLVSCAVAAHEADEKVYIIEMYRQGTVRQWAQACEAAIPEVDRFPARSWSRRWKLCAARAIRWC